MLGRRRFLHMLGATPLAAKMAADAEVAKLSGIDQRGLSGDFSGGASNNEPPSGAGFGEQTPYRERVIKAKNWLRITGMPEVLLAEIREQNRYVSTLDPDIAAKRSWSMAVKVLTQRERNIARAIASYTEDTGYYAVRSTLSKLVGFEWPW